ncbi:ankyrin repeat domain-containing protein [Legionella waltersii]|uniref:Ankyrin repeat protein n=1 Tax=Legionella waltersii TaxID=66969 RepID=A0A0W1A109_9GAMM|nr:ankyrin repeat domain-containing protein [Legionella waltersii]KTD75058.1 Ankyrin repeat protein [Legionella waltersii]SNV05339.1 Ankyrin repeat protein [Legionella waltersii]
MNIFDLARLASDKNFEELVLSTSINTDNINVLDEKKHTPLYYAIKEGNLKMAQTLIENGANLQTNQYTPFLLACHFGQLEMAKFLYMEGAENERDFNDNTPLMVASYNGHTKVVEWLLTLNLDINATNTHGDSALSIALHYKQTDTTKLLLSQEHIVTNKANAMGYDPITLAVVYGDRSLIESLKDSLQVNKTYTENNTMLHMCAMTGNLEAALWLIDHGANPLLRNNFNLRPIDIAAARGKVEIVSLLLSKMAKTKQFFNDLDMVLIFASIQGHTKIIDLVLNHRQHFSSTCLYAALIFAVEMGHIDVVPKLLAIEPKKALKRINKQYDFGNYEYKQGNTLLHVAADKGLLDLVKSLVAQGASVRTRNYNRDTVLHKAVLSGNVELVRWLCNQNVHVNQTNKQGNTPLHLAVKMKNEAMVRCLLLHGAHLLLENKQKESPELLARSEPTLHRVFEEYIQLDFTNFGLPELHRASAEKEEKGILQILPELHNLKEKSVDGLLPWQVAAHLGRMYPLSLLLLWEAMVHKQGAELLALELRKKFDPKSVAYTTLTASIGVIHKISEERVELLLSMYNTAQRYDKKVRESLLIASSPKPLSIKAAQNSNLLLFKPEGSGKKAQEVELLENQACIPQ